MAEVSSLTSAHNHARRAGQKTSDADLKQAAEEHRHAAADFARAAKCTSDNEAGRVLKLLEEQHRRLADIVKSRDVVRSQSSPNEEAKAGGLTMPSEAPPASGKQLEPGKTSTPKSRSATTSMATSRADRYPRDSSPSLARDIASRRGIPQTGKTQPSAAAQARSPQLSPESRQKAASAPNIPPSIVDSQAHLKRSAASRKAEDDDGFAKFYSNLTTGTMSKLSSVLAYAGLPLTADEPLNNEFSSKQSLEKKKTVSASNDPDVKRIFSKAALDAIEDDHRQRGTLGRGFGPAESFYVVQKGGGTHSYADIARAKQQRLGEDDDDEDAEFVDAKEAAGPPSPKHRRASQRGSFGMPRTEEELELENSTLKTTLEQLASRLAAFEAHAQDASMAALTQSMIGVKPMATGSNMNDAVMRERMRLLELENNQKLKEVEEARRQAEVQAKELKRFRRHFEELKESARKKDKLKQERLASLGDGVAGE